MGLQQMTRQALSNNFGKGFFVEFVPNNLGKKVAETKEIQFSIISATLLVEAEGVESESSSWIIYELTHDVRLKNDRRCGQQFQKIDKLTL